MRGNAMSAAPICIGISQFAKPTKAGMIAPNTITSPCTVVSWLKKSGSRSCRPGWKSSVRISSAITPPTRNIVNANHRYIVPMSLWLVVYIQRVNPAGGPWWSWASPCPWSSCAWVAWAICVLRCLNRLLARGLDVGRHDRVRRVAPGGARMCDDRGQLAVREARERCHRRPGLAVQDDGDLPALRAVHQLGARERREGRRQPLARRLVARRAVRRVHLLACGLELVGRPFLVRILGGGRGRSRGELLRGLRRRHLRLGLLHPLGVVGLGLHLDHDGHVRVLLAADLAALPAEGADLGRGEPRILDEPGNAVLVDA